ncbi:aminoglycoside phosphotransferase family protein [Paenibacillus rigui]|uniref:Kinase n=1 Tax=Paenibacillus rigui TaxID=554312 RepID=A0A229UPB0_9BACL|nr:aminoglycoside phosphotransferase family protein [Paenibacillus rigui]OXM85316.1 kinase [Paenibacillus rigui]
MPYPLPEKLVQTILGVHGQKGEQWLREFDELLAHCEQKWSLQVQAPPSPYPLSFNFVAPVRFEDGREAVLKLSVPSKESVTELSALRLYQGRGMVQWLDADLGRGILLIEKLQPGKTLKSIQDDEEATRIAAQVMRRLKTPAPASSVFPSVADWAQGLKKLRLHFNGGTGPMPEDMVAKAEARYQELLSSVSTLQLLHGDLHHENILSAAREPWLAIDPKGVIGEAEYEVISFLMNHLPEAEQHRDLIIQRRAELFAQELNLNPRRVYAWGYCHAILSAWWCIESQTGGMENSLHAAARFDRLLHLAT